MRKDNNVVVKKSLLLRAPEKCSQSINIFHKILKENANNFNMPTSCSFSYRFEEFEYFAYEYFYCALCHQEEFLRLTHQLSVIRNIICRMCLQSKIASRKNNKVGMTVTPFQQLLRRPKPLLAILSIGLQCGQCSSAVSVRQYSSVLCVYVRCT